MRRAVVLAAAAATTATGVVAFRAWRGARPSSLPARGNGQQATLRGITVNRPPEVVYGFWRDLPELAQALGRGVEVEMIDEWHSRWTADGPAGVRVTWHAEIVMDEPNRLIAWRATGSPVPHRGQVELSPAPGDRGTEVWVRLTYHVPAGRLGAAVATLTGDDPDQVLRTALRRTKQLLECGQVVAVDGQPSGRGPVQERVTSFVDHRLATGGRP